MIVRVYRSEHTNKWAVVKVGNGNRKVTFYADELTIGDATFHTGLKGERAVCKSGHKNRHDYVEGRLLSFSGYSLRINNREGVALACHMVFKSGLSNQHVVQEGREDTGIRATIQVADRVEFTSYGKRYIPCAVSVCGSTMGC